MKTRWFIGLAVFLLTLTACTLPSSGSNEYATALERDIPIGQTLPGTDIRYVSKTDQGAQVSIGGQNALKRVFDSLSWRGQPIPGVQVSYNMRVIAYDADSLQVGGTAKVTLTNIRPRAAPPSEFPKNALVLKGGVTYDVGRGKAIPNSTLTYEGKTPDGAKLGGIDGYPYRKEADSIVWTGQLADRLYSQLDLRVVIFDDTSLKTTGTITLLLAP